MPPMDGLDKVGIAGVAIAILWFGFKVFQIFVQQWKQSTDAVNRNSKSFEKLSVVFEKQSAREEKFQENVLATIGDTHIKVTELHGTLVQNRRRADREGT